MDKFATQDGQEDIIGDNSELRLSEDEVTDLDLKPSSEQTLETQDALSNMDSTEYVP